MTKLRIYNFVGQVFLIANFLHKSAPLSCIQSNLMRSLTLRSLSSSIRTCSVASVRAAPTYTSSRNMSTGIPSETAQMQSQGQQTAGGPTNDLGIENTNFKTVPGVELSSDQKIIVGSVLDVRMPPIALYPSTKRHSSSPAGLL